MRIFFLSALIVMLAECSIGQSNGFTRCPYKSPQIPSGLRSDTIGDFTIRTTDGMTRNLYNTLDSGKTVFIDLFFTTCTWCQYYAPIIEEVYQDHGAGNGEIEFWGISNNLQDDDDIIDQYRLNYNITNPCAGPQGGGTTAHTTVISGQNFLGWPTYCVVCPDRSMFFDPVYPPTVDGFDLYFENCAAMVGIGEPAISHPVRIYPNPSKEKVFIQIQNKLNGTVRVDVFNTLGIKVLSSVINKNEDEISCPLDVSSLPEGAYLLHLVMDRQVIGTNMFSIAR